VVRNALAHQHAPADLIDLALGMGPVGVELGEPDRRHTAVRMQPMPGLPRPCEVAFGLLQIDPMGFLDVLDSRAALGLVLGV